MPRYVTTPHSYSSAVEAGDLIFLGLHRGLGDDFAAQLRNTMAGLAATLEKLDRPLGSMISVHVYLKRIEDLAEMEKLFWDYFEPERFPARMTSTTAFFDDDCLIMVDGIATARSDL